MNTNEREWEVPAGWFCWAKRGEPQMDTDGHGWEVPAGGLCWELPADLADSFGGACRLVLLGEEGRTTDGHGWEGLRDGVGCCRRRARGRPPKDARNQHRSFAFGAWGKGEGLK
jgi:hypothetical protein